jgi:antitoxin ParD1/3/4
MKNEPHEATFDQYCLEWWLREEVIPVYDAGQSNPARGLPAERVLASLRAHHAERSKAAKAKE